MNDRTVSAASYAGAAYSVISSLTLTEWGIVTGIVTALLTFVLNAWWGAARDRRDAEAHRLRMERYEHDRRQRDIPVEHDRRGQYSDPSQKGAINKKLAAGMATLSAAGLALIASHEGLRLDAYPDPAHGWNVPTICYGSTDGVKRGQRATFEQCNAMLQRDTSHAGRAVARCTHVSVTQAQYDALVSFVFNVGGGAYCTSALARKLNAGDCWGAAREFNDEPQMQHGRPRIWAGAPIRHPVTGDILLDAGDTVKKWTTGNRVPLPGLIIRRADERRLFESGCGEVTT